MTALLALVALTLAAAAVTEGIGAAFAPRVVVVQESKPRGWGSFILVLALTIAAAFVLAGLASGRLLL